MGVPTSEVGYTTVMSRREDHEVQSGGGSTVHIYTQTIHRTTQFLIWKNAGRAPSLRVITWHLPYNWGKSTENPQYSVQFHHFVIFLLTIALEKYRLCRCFKTITLDLLNNTPHCALYTNITKTLLAFVAFSKCFYCHDGVDEIFILLDVRLCLILAEQILMRRSLFVN
jgi:hypothetical protein